MYAEDRPTLQKILEKVEENNQMLHRLQRARRWASFFSAFKWLVVIASAAGLYYYLQPYLDQWLASWPQIKAMWEGLNSINSLPR
ncbi:MAG: hypothetical protein HYT46_01755 [Candidatus Vogelbacteria bacterium]|nr:hypothetical protein [Candidatus Vogelbacteria bacterium]